VAYQSLGHDGLPVLKAGARRRNASPEAGRSRSIGDLGLAGSLSVTAAFAFVRGKVPPPNVTVTESTASWSAANEDVFALPTGTERRVVRQVHPITSDVVGRGYWLGEEWDGAPPDFAAVSLAAGFVAVLVVYPRICVTTLNEDGRG
jgi:hypothetical protein